MQIDWLSNLLPIINAAGIPILTIGIIMLLKAYQKATDTYSQIANKLRDENDRLSKRLASSESEYFKDYEKMKVMASSSLDAIQELQARKIVMLTEPENTTNKEILVEIKKINEAIYFLQSISDMSSRHWAELHSLKTAIQHQTIQMGELAEQIGDTKSRIAVLGVMSSVKIVDEIKDGTDIRKRGIVALPPEKKLPEPESKKENLLDNSKSENTNTKGFASLPKYTEEEMKNRKSS